MTDTRTTDTSLPRVSMVADVTASMPLSINIGKESYEFKFDVDINAQVQRFTYEQLINLWNARGSPAPIHEIADSPFFSAVVTRLIFGKSIGIRDKELLLRDHYANS